MKNEQANDRKILDAIVSGKFDGTYKVTDAGTEVSYALWGVDYERKIPAEVVNAYIGEDSDDVEHKRKKEHYAKASKSLKKK